MNFKNSFSRPLFIIYFNPKILISTGHTKVESVAYQVLRMEINPNFKSCPSKVTDCFLKNDQIFFKFFSVLFLIPNYLLGRQKWIQFLKLKDSKKQKISLLQNILPFHLNARFKSPIQNGIQPLWNPLVLGSGANANWLWIYLVEPS